VRNFNLISDLDVCHEIGRQIKEQRLNINKKQDDISEAAGIGIATLIRFENGSDIKLSNFIGILRALGKLEELEALFAPINSPVAELLMTRKAVKRKQRVSRATVIKPHSFIPVTLSSRQKELSVDEKKAEILSKLNLKKQSTRER
jgi:Helix-turn-helix.